MDEKASPDDADLLHGVEAIARFLGLHNRRQVYHMIETAGLPTFRLVQGRVCARKAALLAWISERVAASKEGR